MNFPACPLPPGTNVLAYNRVSPGPTQSIDSQNDYLMSYIKFYQLNLAHPPFEDRSISGGKLFDQQGLVYLVSYATNLPTGQVDAILFYDSSRMARDMDAAAQVKALLRQHGYRLIFIQDPIPGGPEGRIVETVYDYAAQKWREQLRELVKRGHKFVRQLKDENGRYVGIYAGRIPFGFLTERVDIGLIKNNGQPRCLTRITGPDPELAPKILQAYQLRADDWNCREIERELNLFGWSMGLSSLAPDENLQLYNRYRHLFNFPIYKGVYVYNEKIYLQDGYAPPDDKKVYAIKRRNPFLNGAYIVKRYYIQQEIYENFVKPIVPTALWEAVQEKKYKRPGRGESWPSDQRHPKSGTAKLHILSGLCFCAHCKKMMYSKTSTPKNKGGRYIYYTYNCQTRQRYGVEACQISAVNASILEPVVVEYIYQTADWQFISEFTEQLNAALAARKPGCEIERYEQAAAALKKRRTNLLMLVTEGDKDAEALYRQLGRELTEAEAKLNFLTRERAFQPIQVDREEVEGVLNFIKVSLDTDDIEARRTAIRRMVTRVEVGKKDDGLLFAEVTPKILSLVCPNNSIRFIEDTINGHRITIALPISASRG